jgi:hypothetical protein
LRSLQLIPQQRVDVSGLALGEFAACLGLPITPPLPLLNTESTTDEREVIRGKKNVNRSLDKLKKQIKEAKEEKKRQRLGVLDQSKSDSDSEEESESESDDDFLQVKQTHTWVDAGQCLDMVI